MFEETSGGAAYLAGLRRPASQSASGATTASPEKIPPSVGNGDPTENRRKSPRYRCQGSARLQEVATGISTWATFTDISLHGCYVEAMSAFRKGARVALTMEVNGFRIECNAEVRVVYPNLGMGMCFTVMSEADRERLRELLRSLSRPSVILGARPEAAASPSPRPDALPPIVSPAAALQAVSHFFEERQILSREEFFRIVRKSQNIDK